jgi:hypothetical protein
MEVKFSHESSRVVLYVLDDNNGALLQLYWQSQYIISGGCNKGVKVHIWVGSSCDRMVQGPSRFLGIVPSIAKLHRCQTGPQAISCYTFDAMPLFRQLSLLSASGSSENNRHQLANKTGINTIYSAIGSLKNIMIKLSCLKPKMLMSFRLTSKGKPVFTITYVYDNVRVCNITNVFNNSMYIVCLA